MAAKNVIEIIDVTRENVDQTGFFCCMSKRKSSGYQRKLRWLKARFDEGMQLKILGRGERGFIEYVPGEFAWRAVEAKGYMFVHCLWVVGKCKGKGYGSFLLQKCISDAKEAGMKGVAMVTSDGNWLTSKKLLLKHGFACVAHAPPSLELMVRKFGRARSPKFVGEWDEKCRRCGKGLTIFRTGQCPYLDDAVDFMLEAAEQREIKARVVDLEDAQSVRDRAPCAYGTFGAVYNGALLTYHYLTRRDLATLFGEAKGAGRS